MLIKIFRKPPHLVKKKSFFDLPASEKKKIIKRAAKEATVSQKELLRRYDSLYAK